MNTDIRLSVGFWQHPKTKKTAKRLGLEGIRSLQVLWLWAAVNRPDGVLSSMDWEDIELAADWQGQDKGFFDFCLSSEGASMWIDTIDGVYVLHDWAEHNSWAAEAEDRQNEARFNALKRYNPKVAGQLESMGIKAVSKEEYATLKATGSVEHGYLMGGQWVPIGSSNAPKPSPKPKEEDIKKNPKGFYVDNAPALSTPHPENELQESREEKKPAISSPPDCPHEKILDLYHSTLPELPKARTWGKDRQKLLRCRWRETWERLRKADKPHDLPALLEWWTAYFARVRASPFLTGKVLDRTGTPFFADLEWLVRPRNYAKVIDGRYLERRPAA